MLGIIGKKIGMTRIYDEKDRVIACTIVQGGPCVVTQIKEIKGKDRYNAVQLAFDDKKEKNTTKSLKGHFDKANSVPKKRVVEFRNFAQDYGKKLELGDQIGLLDLFEEGEFIDVVGRSKGKGFQGVVKRHGFSGVGDRSHGQHNRERAPGSIGAGSDPSRVFKGMRMAGRDGNKRVKVKNLEVVKILEKENCILLKGAIPGAKNGYVTLEK